MKVITLLSLGLLALALNSRADVLVYKSKILATETGGGTVLKTTYAGWLVMQADTGDYTYIYVNAKNKTFYTYTPTNCAIDYLDAGFGKSYMVISELTASGTYTFKGLEAYLATGTPSLWSAGKVLQHIGFEMIYGDTEDYLYEEKGTASFDSKTTQVHNAIDGDMDNTVSRLVNQLLLLGYTSS